MMRFYILTVVIYFGAAVQARLIDYVDVFVGTEGDHGQLYPGATLPFGLVKLSPDTGGDGHSGYDYANPTIKGFSHTRIGGVGCRGAGGSVKIKPAFGRSETDTLDKSTERGHPGFYGVAFTNGIQADLTVSYRVGFHRYTFPASEEDIYIHIDPSQSYAGSQESTWNQVGSDVIAGFTKGKNVCGHGYYKLYYAVKYDRDITQVETEGQTVWCRFPAAVNETVIKLKVGISPISVEQAIVECDNDIPGWSFDSARARAENHWEKTLGKVEIPDVPVELEEYRDLFYTCLYRCYLLPHNVTSSDGQYRMAGDEETIRQVRRITPHYVHYAGWSVWDDYRKFSLISLLEPETAHNIARSVVEWVQAGHTPAWADGYWPCPSVRNEFINTIVLDAYQKGLRDYDLQGAYEGLVSSVQGNPQVEKPYQYYVAMKIAQLLGKEADAEALRAKALGYLNYWAASQVDGEGNIRGFFTPNGRNISQGSVNTVDAHFYEGNLWHYRFFVPHDIQGLATLRGGRNELADDPEYYFRSGQHMPLNEPPLAYPFLFNYLGRSHRTQYWSRVYITETVTSRYHNHGLFNPPVNRRVYQKQPAGWLKTMDDDTGAMSSQFVFSALGLYPACMGDPYYVIGSPLFPEVILHLKGGDFIIRADRASLANKYIQSMTWNGRKFPQTWLHYDRIKDGGALAMIMGPMANTEWGTDPDMSPPSLSKCQE